MTLVAMISMKGHSSRVPGKNLRPFLKRPLYSWILDALLNAKRVDQVIVETDSDEIQESVQTSYDVSVFRRPPELIGDHVPMNDLIAFNMKNVPADIYVQTHATNPLLKSETIDRAIDTFLENKDNYDSLFGVTERHTRLFWTDGRPLNHDPDELIPTQELPPVYEENSNIYVFTRESFAKRKHRIGARPYLFPIDPSEAIDIDEEIDFEFAEFLAARKLRTGNN